MSDNMEDSNDNNILVESAERNAADEMDGEEEDSDYDEEESDDESDWIDFDEDILRRLKDNDPTVFSLSVMCSGEGFNALSIDWKLEGGAIAENTHLKSLSTTYYNPEGDENAAAITNAKAFYGALSKNRSIKNLSMDGCPIDVGLSFTILSPLFEHNQNLRKLHITDGEFDARSSQLLLSALSKCNPTSLRKFILDCTGIEDDSAAKLVTILGRFLNLRGLNLYFNQSNNGEKWCIALGELLQKSKPVLECLDFSSNHIINERAATLGSAIGQSKKLKKLTMNIESITPSGCVALLRGLSNPNSQLEELDLCGNEIGDEGGIAFAAAIATNTKLKILNLEYHSFSFNGWSPLLKSLVNQDSILENLYLAGANIGNRELSVLGNALGNNSTLKTLHFRRNQNITANGWTAFFECLSLNSSLEDINVKDNNVDNESLASLVSALENNTHLKRLNLSMCALVSSIGWQTFFDRLQTCNLVLEVLLLSSNNSINNEGIISLVNALANINSLSSLCLGNNSSITPVGWMAFSTILQQPDSNLEVLRIGNNTNDAVVVSFANALSNNTSLKTLEFGLHFGTPISSRGIEAIGNLVCDKSSIESIYSSNHTLQHVDLSSSHLDYLLYLNKSTNNSHVAIKKILKYHPNIDMEPLFEWNMEGEGERDLKALPYVVAWFDRAGEAVADAGVEESYNIDETKLTAMYQFAKAMPLLFVPFPHAKGGDNKRKRDDD